MRKKKPRILLVNEWETPNGTRLRSRHRHDFVACEENGETYFVDGGLWYCRTTGNLKDCCVYSDDPHDVIRERYEWRKTPLKDISSRNLETVLLLGSLRDEEVIVFETELQLRKEGKYPDVDVTK